MTSFSKWLPGGHIRFFGFWMAWFWQCNSSLLWNFSFKFHVHVFSGCRQKPNDCQLCRFQNGCLVILNNVQLQSTHCPLPPSPMGRGILVDHWSTISSYFLPRFMISCMKLVIFYPRPVLAFEYCRCLRLSIQDKKEEASMRCSLLHGSWDQILQRRPSVRP